MFFISRLSLNYNSSTSVSEYFKTVFLRGFLAVIDYTVLFVLFVSNHPLGKGGGGWRNNPHWTRTSSFTRFLYHTQQRTIFSSTPLDEWLACRGDLYQTTHNTHERQISLPAVGFESTVSAGERPQTYALDRAATGSSVWAITHVNAPTNLFYKTFFLRTDSCKMTISSP
jgi:hypothetical protein